MLKTKEARWTNPSVLRFAGDKDPVQTVIQKAREVIVKALDAGWTGPPFNPLDLAKYLNIPVVARDDVRDARTVPVGKKDIRIEFSPNQSLNRIRYSLAHEIAHSLFPDCVEWVRNRSRSHEQKGDDWQLEALCNIGAAEFLMPSKSLPSFQLRELTMERLIELQREYEVSAEALLIRVTRMADEPCAMFCASQIGRGKYKDRYKLDYVIPSGGWKKPLARGLILPEDSAVAQCIAIGFTARKEEQWDKDLSLHIECVGIPPYPGQAYPQVVGILTRAGTHSTEGQKINFVRGDATEPRGTDSRIIAQIVNDRTQNWGGRGFAQAVGRKWPHIQEDFKRWVGQERSRLRLGNYHFTQVDDDLGIFHMVCQHGYGSSPRPRIRYVALEKCLRELVSFAKSSNASVHMPRIGTGQAGGSWDVIQDLIIDIVCAQGIQVTVYDPPGSSSPSQQQLSLTF